MYLLKQKFFFSHSSCHDIYKVIAEKLNFVLINFVYSFLSLTQATLFLDAVIFKNIPFPFLMISCSFNLFYFFHKFIY